MNASLLATIGILAAGYGVTNSNLSPSEEQPPLELVIEQLRDIQEARDYRISQYAAILRKPQEAFHAPGHMNATDLDAVEEYLRAVSLTIEANDTQAHFNDGWIMPAPGAE